MRLIDYFLGAFLVSMAWALIFFIYGWYTTEQAFIKAGYKKAVAPGCFESLWIAPTGLPESAFKNTGQ